jgi:uncharacterized protein (TIGR02266 family)
MPLRELRVARPARWHGVSIDDADLPETLGRARADSGTQLLGSVPDEDGPWAPPVPKLSTTRRPPRPGLKATRQPSGPGPDVDRRGALRRLCMVDVEFTDDVQFYHGVTHNLSAGGLFVRTRVILPVSSVVALRFELPDGGGVEAHACVRWLCEANTRGAHAGVGLQFTALSRGALERISEFSNGGVRL